MNAFLQGKAWKFGNDVDTDLIIPARYLNTSDPQELAAHCMEDADPGFAKKVRAGELIVGGKNFGCGSSREHAPLAIKAAGVSCVIAASFARIFYRNAINIGLPILESPEASAAIAEGHTIEVDLATGRITDQTSGQSFQAAPFPSFMQELIRAGGLIEYVRERLTSRQG
ncbi:3-isopropylmalate/(R)-2-methylmalate dehydratase small subunit [Hydrogenispora ethanolica]|jgi:3-isopropylmalate dehydratase small subunit|uniref:3-isopropylmalate dehydratase small subunit n=1 Tax=Hydrogenispora ethanolica TaxID=1082276 RepID=A0A4R1RC27_HYDET|nr:3-isopropylmalate dehydratase small subunit [Hydrogenispora ethanolica]TCL63289.1 3-isopropylmalate/(R)-2-methylmalate dehydratase small subunit [Hydrogenispora ethanolica]